MAIANIPQRSFIGGRDDLITKTSDYNAALPAFLDSMFTDESPLYLVEFEQFYDCMCSCLPLRHGFRFRSRSLVRSPVRS
jgi:hypothetical protein